MESQKCVCAAAFGSSGHVTYVESESTDMEAELSLGKMLFCFISGPVAFSTKLILAFCFCKFFHLVFCLLLTCHYDV